MEKFVTTKATEGGIRLLRLISAWTGERQHVAFTRIMNAEWERLTGGEKDFAGQDRPSAGAPRSDTEQEGPDGIQPE